MEHKSLAFKCAVFAVYFGGRISKTLLGSLFGCSTANIRHYQMDKGVLNEYKRLGLEGMFHEYVTTDLASQLEEVGYKFKPWSNW
jgi:hypothetical protein